MKTHKRLAADDFRRDAKRLIHNYFQRSTMMGDAIMWQRIIARYEACLPLKMRQRVKDLGY